MLQALGIHSHIPTCIIACYDPRQTALNEFEKSLCLTSMPHDLQRPYGGPIGLTEKSEQGYWERQLATAFHKVRFFRFALIGHTGTCRHCEEHELFPTENSCEYAFWGNRLSEAECFIQKTAQKHGISGVTVESFIYDVDQHLVIPAYQQKEGGNHLVHRQQESFQQLCA